MTADATPATGSLRLDGLQAVRRGKPLSRPITANLPAGTILAVVGPNGSGKSSLLGAMAQTGIDRHGTLVYDGRDLAGLDPRSRARMLSFLAQDGHAPEELLVRELVGIGAYASGRDDATQAIATALADVGIPDLADRRLGTLSGGQRQLAHLARVLVQHTPIVVLDEPTSALDLAHQAQLERTALELSGEGRIVVIALHDLSFALNAATHVLLLTGTGDYHLGAPREVLHPDIVHIVYGVRTRIHTTSGGRSFLSHSEPFPERNPS